MGRRINPSVALAALLFIGSAVYLANAWDLSFGSWRAPRAGFLPIIVGTIGTVLAAANLVGTALAPEIEADIGDAPWRAALFAAALAAFVPALALMGYVPATFAILLALLKIHGAGGCCPAARCGGSHVFGDLGALLATARAEIAVMESLTALLSGFGYILTLPNLTAAGVGVILGTLAGMLPGLGLSGTIALLIPISFGLDPLTALVLFAGIYYGAAYGGSTTSILLNVPGEGASVVTCIEGFPMARRGRAGAALAVAAIGSFVAGFLGLICLVFLAGTISGWALAFGPEEYFCISFLALVTLSGVTGGSFVRAALMAAAGVMIGTIGMDPMTGLNRFTLGTDALLAGVSFIIVVMGAYGIAEIMQTAATTTTPTAPPRLGLRELMPTSEEAARSAGAIGRGSLIGLGIGLIPGPSGTISSFLSYAVEKRLGRQRDEFGRGAIEGVAGPEAANNGADTSTLIPLLSLGIPFNSGAALLLTGFLIHGITPGPNLVNARPDLFWGLVASMFVGNLMLLVINLPLVGLFASVLRVPMVWLMPVVAIFVATGAFFINGATSDMLLVVCFGVAGYVLRGFGYPLAPLIIGVFLGPLVEKSFTQSMVLLQGDFLALFAHPLSGTMLGITCAFIVLRASLSLLRRRGSQTTPGAADTLGHEPIKQGRNP